MGVHNIMEPYTQTEIHLMRKAFNSIEKAYLTMGEDFKHPDSKEHRRVNKSLVDELNKPSPDHEKIYYLLQAINTLQNGKQQTNPAESSEEEPKSKKAYGLKRWIQKIHKNRN